MNGNAISITYDTLFDLLKREKERPELQKLEPSFFKDVVLCLKQKSDMNSPISTRQLDNLKKILRELYERREKKIVIMALDKSRTKSNLVDTSALLNEERIMFNAIVNLLDELRNQIVESILEEKEPVINIELSKPELSIVNKEKNVEQNMGFKSALSMFKPNLAQTTPAEKEKGARLIRFVHAVPKFVGTELEEYGPFQEEDIAKLPAEIADVLISKGRAEGIEES